MDKANAINGFAFFDTLSMPVALNCTHWQLSASLKLRHVQAARFCDIFNEQFHDVPHLLRVSGLVTAEIFDTSSVSFAILSGVRSPCSIISMSLI